MSGGLEPGATFAGHRIEGELGRGGMGIVYRAVHVALARPRALKILAPQLSADPAYATRFRRESRLAAAVEHPAVVTVHHAGEEDGRLYMSMQLVDGVDLGRLLADGPLRPDRVAALLTQLAAGLDAAHAAGLVHRDVKPENVLVDGPLERERAYLTDFGIGTVTRAPWPGGGSEADDGTVLGSTGYIAPEQMDGGTLDHRADVYGLGCLALHMLSGRAPAADEGRLPRRAAREAGLQERALVLPPELGPAVAGVLAAATAVDPDARPPGAGVFAAELALALGAADAPGTPSAGPRALPRAVAGPRGPVPVTREITSGPNRRRRPRMPRAASAFAGVLLLLAVVAGGLLDARGGRSAPLRVAPDESLSLLERPVAVVAGGGKLWVASRAAARVRPFDPRTGRQLGIGYSIHKPRALVTAFGSLWAINRGHLFRLGLDHHSRERVARLWDGTDVAAGRSAIWVSDRAPVGRVLAIDPRGKGVAGRAFVGRDPRALIAREGSVWVANTADGSVSQVSETEIETRGKPLAVGGRPSDLVSDSRGIWVVDNFGGKLVRIDPDAGPAGEPAVAERLETGARPRAVATGFGSIWVANGEDGTVWRFDRDGRKEPREVVDVGPDPVDLAVGLGAVWAASTGGSGVSQIKP